MADALEITLHNRQPAWAARAALIRDIKDQLDKGNDGREGVWL